MPTVYRFKLKEQPRNQWVVQPTKATKEAIVLLGGLIVEGSAEDVPDQAIDPDGYYHPRHLNPFWR
jgi:hypothetical protein